MKKLLLFSLVISICFTAICQSFKVGDKVEAYNSGAWYKATVTEVGTAEHKGYCYIKYDEYSSSQWIANANIRLISKAAANVANTGPRNGTYIILSYGSPSNPLRLGYFDLANGHYTYYNLAKKIIGKGTYTYDNKTKTVQWTSGPFRDAKWNGGFEIDREGKTHKIRLNRVTIGSNSTDSK